jgi:malonate transporter and related proteins
MLETILGALLPMVVTFLLGFVAAWRRDFGPKDAAILNRMVLLYAVPLMLFAGTVSTPRAELSQDLPLLIALCVAIVSLYGAVLLLSRFTFRRRMSTSALAALTASAPAVPFSAVLGYLFGGPGAIPIAMASLVVNLTLVPVTDPRTKAVPDDPDLDQDTGGMANGDRHCAAGPASATRKQIVSNSNRPETCASDPSAP